MFLSPTYKMLFRLALSLLNIEYLNLTCVEQVMIVIDTTV